MASRVWSDLLVLLVIFVCSVSSDDLCPLCDKSRDCLQELKCPQGQVIQENQDICGCCPGCVRVIGLGDLCSPTFGPKCYEGLECDEASRVCVIKSGSCRSFQNMNVLWKPDCDDDGSFSAKQCKGEYLTGRCFCYSGVGTRLFGTQWWSKAENMTCACSRRVWEMQNASPPRTDVTLHCNEFGNYEALQCDNKLCWCADEMTGEPITSILPEALMTVLPCYNATITGSQYLRICESKVIGAALIAIEMAAHGTEFVLANNIHCDPDGSYGNYLVSDDNICVCINKDGSSIKSYAINANAMQGTNCRCARDELFFSEAGETLGLLCKGNGNYEPAQSMDHINYYCVDEDGFPTTNPVTIPPGSSLDCTNYPI